MPGLSYALERANGFIAFRVADDAARVFERAIIAPLDQLEVPFAVVFGVSNSNWPLYDLEHGRRAIGYDPQDFADVPPEQRV